MARTTKIIKEIKSQFVIHTITYASLDGYSHNKSHMEKYQRSYSEKKITNIEIVFESKILFKAYKRLFVS